MTEVREKQKISPESLLDDAMRFVNEAEETGDKSKYDLAGGKCESAYWMYPENETGNRIFAGQAAIGFYMKSRSLGKVVSMGEELLARYGDSFPPESRAQLKDFNRLTRIQMGQEEVEY